MIKEHLRNAIENIKAEMNAAINEVRVRVTNEKIVPYNTEIDKKAELAISELEKGKTEKIVEIQSTFEQNKANILQHAEQNKAANAAAVIEEEIGIVKKQYDYAILNLTKQLEDLGG